MLYAYVPGNDSHVLANTSDGSHLRRALIVTLEAAKEDMRDNLQRRPASDDAAYVCGQCDLIDHLLGLLVIK